MKWFVSYLKDDEIMQAIIMADECREVSEYMQQIGATTYSITGAKGLLQQAKPMNSVVYSPKVIATSKLAKVEIAAEDYDVGGREIDGKHYFTFDEAQDVQKKLGSTGWRLPTRSEWVLICEEFGQKDGELDWETLYKNLDMNHTGWVDKEGYLSEHTTNGNWWSGTASSAVPGRYLYTWTGGVNAQDSYWRGGGFALRLVRDVKEAE